YLEKTSLKGSQLAGDRKFFQGRRGAALNPRGRAFANIRSRGSLCASEGRRPRRPQASPPANGTPPWRQPSFSPDRGCVSRRRILSRKERKVRKEMENRRFSVC
ncbi:MAG: hypothetical protein IKX40_13820, partial [Thermoguttaceae bacterium]|nr:hypothetical protein [Thermoguttaceae bacterium]